MTKYIMYKEIQDKINSLLKENRKLKQMIDILPDEIVDFMYKNTKNKGWRDVYNERTNKK